MTVLHGLVPPLCTPLRDDGRLDPESARSLIRYQLEAGVDGVFVLGSSGEAAYLDADSRRELVQLAADECPRDKGLLVGCLASTAQRVVDEISDLGVLDTPGVDGIVVTAPYYGRPSDREIERHFSEVKDRIGSLGLYAYQIPSNVGYQIPVSVLASLFERGVLAGYKDSSTVIGDFRELVSALEEPREFDLFTGSDVLADLYLRVGCSGLIPGLGNIRPKLFRDLLDHAAIGDFERVEKIRRSIAELAKTVRVGESHGFGRHASQLGALKHVLQHDGVISSSRTSAPLEQLSAEARRDIDAVMVRVAELSESL